MKTIILAGLSLLAMSAGEAQAANCSAANSIISVRNTSFGLHEYVVFRFKKPPNAPAYQVSTVVPPFKFDPSNSPVNISGSQFKKILFTNVEWTCSVVEAFTLPKIALKGIKRVAQFEGQIAYVIGRKAASKYVATYDYASSGGTQSIVMKFKK